MRIHPVSRAVRQVTLCAGLVLVVAGCGQRLPLPSPPPPPSIPTDQYIVDAEWTGYSGVTDLLLTRFSFGSKLLIVRDSLRVECYYPGSESNRPQMRSNDAVLVPEGVLTRPVHIAEGHDGTLYVADLNHGFYDAQVIHLSEDGRTLLGVMHDRHDGNDSTLVEWRTVDGIAVDADGNVFISGLIDSIIRNPVGTLVERRPSQWQIRRLPATGMPSPWTTPGSSASRSTAARPGGLFADETGLLVADRGSDDVPSRVLKLSLVQALTGVEGFGGADGFIQRVAQPAPKEATDVAADSDGNIYFSDPLTARVLRFDPTGTKLLQLVNEPGQVRAGSSQLVSPTAVTASITRQPGKPLASGRVFVADPATNRIVRYVFQP